jgi:hypothetical protein
MSSKSSSIVDYPFTNWTDYFKALLKSFQTEFLDDTYPIYDEILREGNVTDVKIMLDILARQPTKEWAQEGLDGLIKTVVDGSRYSYEHVNSFETVFEKMIALGAVVNLSYIINKNAEASCFEDDSYSFNPRGKLLFLFEKIGVEMPPAIKNATPIYWEDIVDAWENEPKQYSDEYMKGFYNGIKWYMEPEEVNCMQVNWC